MMEGNQDQKRVEGKKKTISISSVMFYNFSMGDPSRNKGDQPGNFLWMNEC
jgi:hypothetical protein